MDLKSQLDGSSPLSWLGKDFIQRALGDEDKDSAVEVLSWNVTAANAVGDGYASDMYRVTVKFQDRQKSHMIVKCHPQGGCREEVVRSISAFEIETGMLTEMLPAMHRLLEEARPGEFNPLSAKCLYHGSDPIEFIVLEDLRQLGFTLANRQQGLDLAHCSLALKTLARFHASSLVLHNHEPSSVECYKKGLIDVGSRKHMETLLDNSLLSLEKEVSKWPGWEEYVYKIKKLRRSFFDRLVDLCKRKDGEFNVLNHGDMWTSNMMFKYSDDVLEDVRLVDFQLSLFASPAIDLQYFLHTCPSDEVRVQHMDTMIQSYHNELIRILDILGYPKHAITLQQLMKTFNDYYLYGVMAATCILPIALSDAEDNFDFEKHLAVKNCSQEGSTVYSNPRFVKVIKRLLPLFADKGVM
ncbi:uncharacterized protein [Anabrus simplex]|uniref:uncharacterized protein n=1 Tax=Anabrus simplex TaxID=316456 RepID=UPI0035A3A0E7